MGLAVRYSSAWGSSQNSNCSFLLWLTWEAAGDDGPSSGVSATHGGYWLELLVSGFRMAQP